MTQCKGTTTKGARCQRKVTDPSGYCSQHRGQRPRQSATRGMSQAELRLARDAQSAMRRMIAQAGGQDAITKMSKQIARSLIPAMPVPNLAALGLHVDVSLPIRQLVDEFYGPNGPFAQLRQSMLDAVDIQAPARRLLGEVTASQTPWSADLFKTFQMNLPTASSVKLSEVIEAALKAGEEATDEERESAVAEAQALVDASASGDPNKVWTIVSDLSVSGSLLVLPVLVTALFLLSDPASQLIIGELIIRLAGHVLAKAKKHLARTDDGPAS